MRIIKLEDTYKLTKLRDEAWDSNAQQWSKKRELPVKLKEAVFKGLDFFLNKDSLIVDVGCGNAWVVDFIFYQNSFRTNYLGLDINKYFTSINIKKYKELQNVSFQNIDFEKTHKPLLIGKHKKRIFVCCLSLIEMVDLSIVFDNISKNMKKSDILILVVLNPSFEIFRLSESFSELKDNLVDFFSNKLCYYTKDIIFPNNTSSETKYIGVLHHLNKYHFFANKNELTLFSNEIVNEYNENNEKGTVYHIFKYKRL